MADQVRGTTTEVVYHSLGTSIQDIGPLDGNGGVHRGLAVRCGPCGEKFMVAVSLLREVRGYHIQSPERELYCPYCGVKAPAVASSNRLTDTRRSWGDD